MPPKKEEKKEKKILLGRPSNVLKMGIIGLPMVGKTSIFNCMAKLNMPTSTNVFSVKEPNKAQVRVPDPRFEKLVQMWKPKLATPTSIYVVDVAGVLPQSGHAGLGSAFTGHLQEVDGLYHVLRAFDDPSIEHVSGEVNPVNDLQVVFDELIEKDKQVIAPKIEEVEKHFKRTKEKNKEDELNLLKKVLALLEQKKYVKDADWEAQEVDLLNKCAFLTAKPLVYLINLSEEDFINKKNKHLQPIVKWVSEHGGGPIIPVSVPLETGYMKAENPEKFLAEKKSSSAISKIIRTGYSALKLIHYFTVGEDEVKCWSVREGSTAKRAAGVIHSDLEKGFICADVIKYQDMAEIGNEAEIKAQGKLRQQGKDYIVEDGDCIEFKTNAAKKKKK